MYRFVTAFVLLFFVISCTKEQMQEANATVKDFTGLDGCGKVIVLDNGEVLEPAIIPGNSTLIPDRRVSIIYKKLSDRASACMVGPIIEITSLRYL
jgi:hypothetical protein